MNLNCWEFCLTIALLVRQMFPAAAAAAENLSTLTCNVTKQPDGLFLYQLSRPPSSSQCDVCWEGRDKTVIVRNSNLNRTLVHNMSDQFIILKSCWDYLHYTQDCKAWEEAHCIVNCSHFKDASLNTGNSTLICFNQSWCLTELQFGLVLFIVVAAVFFIVILSAGVYWALYHWNLCQCRRRESAAFRASYTPANGQIRMDGEETVVNIKMVQKNNA